MTTSDPPNTQTSAWQLPWLRMSLILRNMAASSDCPDEDVAALVEMRRVLIERGWFN